MTISLADETPQPPEFEKPAAELFGIPVWFDERDDEELNVPPEEE